MEPLRELAELRERAVELAPRRLEQLRRERRVALQLLSGEAEREPHRDKPLLRPAVKIPLEPPALLVRRLDEPRPRRSELAPRLGAGDCDRDELGEVP